MHVAEFLNLHGDVQPISFFDAAVLAPGLKGMMIGVRPEDIRIVEEEGDGGLPARVKDVAADPIQQNLVVTLDLRGHELVGKLPTGQSIAPSQELRLAFRKYHVFDTNSGNSKAAPTELKAMLA
jgi:ABC-type sugar transport system ATPase subunit